MAVLDATTGIPSMIGDVHTIFFSNASPLDKVMAGADLLLNVGMDAAMVVGVGEGLRVAYVGVHVAEHVAEDVGAHAIEHAGEDAVAHTVEHEAESEAEHATEHAVEDGAESCALSFAATTLVATPLGVKAIASLKAGNKVLAYDPATGTASTQTVTATSIHHDDNLVDITLRVTTPATSAAAASHVPQAPATAGKAASQATTSALSQNTASAGHDEVVHTTTNHPWLTGDHGWLPASFLRVGEPVVQLDGTTATVEAIHVVPGTAAMWDLTVSNVHTFAVGSGEFVVHNANVCNFGSNRDPMNIDHIMGEHGEEEFQRLSQLADRGGRAGTEARATLETRTFFRGMSREEVERTVRQAWFNREKSGAMTYGAKGEIRQLWRGQAGRRTIEGVYDWVRRTIHTAYPL